MVWSKISNVLKRLGFRSRNFSAQLLSETSRACTIRVRRSSLRRLWNDLGSHACLHHRNRRPGTTTEERISDRREPDPESPNQRQVAVIRCRKATLAEIAHRLGRKALEELAAVRNRIRCWPGTESSSPTSSTDRSFANPMLATPLQAIGGTRTFTSQDSQHCRLLLTARYFSEGPAETYRAVRSRRRGCESCDGKVLVPPIAWSVAGSIGFAE